MGVYKLTPIVVLEYKMGFLLLQIYLKKLAITYVEKTQEGLIREYIKRECNII